MVFFSGIRLCAASLQAALFSHKLSEEQSRGGLSAIRTFDGSSPWQGEHREKEVWPVIVPRIRPMVQSVVNLPEATTVLFREKKVDNP